MREIRFRAWDSVQGEFISDWNTGDYSGVEIRNDGSFDVISSDLRDTMTPAGHQQDEVWERFSGDHISLTQYTGLKDSKGVEIYEGDIVEWFINDLTRIGRVYYDADFCCYELSGSSNSLICWDPGRGRNLVIGNIHEHPDLLQDKGEE